MLDVEECPPGAWLAWIHSVRCELRPEKRLVVAGSLFRFGFVRVQIFFFAAQPRCLGSIPLRGGNLEGLHTPLNPFTGKAMRSLLPCQHSGRYSFRLFVPRSCRSV